MTIHPNSLSARDLAQRVRSGALKAQAVTQAVLEHIATRNPELNAIVQDTAEEALRDAAKIDDLVAQSQDPGPFSGVPFTVKVISDQAGYATTNGVTLNRDLVASEDAPFLTRMRRAGGIVVGRTNTPAFSYRWFCSNQMHGTTLNPRNPGLTPGGSSGGAGAAVASGMGHVGHGTDIAGSIRYPAYACGVQGLRPTPGRVAAFNASGADRPIGAQIMAVSGPLARRVDDLRLGLEAMSGYEPSDPWSAPVPIVGGDFQRRVAFVPHPDGMTIDPRTQQDLERAAGFLRQAGWLVETPSVVPGLARGVRIQTDLWLCDRHARQLAVAQSEGDPGAMTILGRFAEQAKAWDADRFGEVLEQRSHMVRDWRKFLSDYPIVLMPVSGELPFKRDEDLDGPEALERIWTAQMPQIALPVTGLPCMTVTSGTIDGTPAGVQLVAPPWREDICMLAGEIVEAGFGIPTV